MTYFIERDGPSKLDERLEAFKDPDTEDILITKNQAIGEVIESLLGFYRGHIGSPSPKIEALVQIIRSPLPYDKFNFSEILETEKEVQRQRESRRREREKMERAAGIIPPKPPQAEI